MALTKLGSPLDACQAVAQNVLVEGAVGDLDGAYEATLMLQLALTTETAHAGTRIVVQVSDNDAGDEDWFKLTAFMALQATAASEAITNAPAAIGTTVFTCASTTGFTAVGRRFLQDITVFANSEWLDQISYAAGVSITMVDGCARAHAQNSVLYTQADSRAILLPSTARRVRVLYDNTYAPTGSAIAVRSRITAVTGT